RVEPAESRQRSTGAKFGNGASPAFARAAGWSRASSHSARPLVTGTVAAATFAERSPKAISRERRRQQVFKTQSGPQLPVERAQLDGFRNVFAGYVLRAGQVGNGS